MAVAGIDAKFINSIVRGLKQTTPKYVHARTRSSVAVIFRFGDTTSGSNRADLASIFPDRRVIEPTEVAQRLLHNMKLDAPSNLQVLFVKRADIDEDRWSGSVSFPGGRRDIDDADDFETVRREAYEELGIPLNTPDFILLGKLPDYKIMSRQTTNEGIVQSRFVFLHVGTMAPTVKFASHEIEAIQWYPLDSLNAKNVETRRVMHGLTQFFRASTADQRLLVSELFGGTFAYFPSLRIFNKWNVWGLPLRTISELLEMDNRRAVDWPMFRVSNPVFQLLFVDAYHGYKEWKDKMPRKNTKHQLALLLDTLIVSFIVLTILDAIRTIGFFIGVATGLSPDARSQNKLKEYWDNNTPKPH